MIKQAIYKLVSREHSNLKINKAFNVFISLLIVLSLVLIALESYEYFWIVNSHWMDMINYTILLIFSIEYMMRLYVSDLTHPAKTKFRSLLRFMFSFAGLVDLLAILPFFVPIMNVDLRVVRLVRLARFIRVFKGRRSAETLKMLKAVIVEKKDELINTGIIAAILLVISAVLMYFAEGDVQPDSFGTIPDSLWWAVETLTTVGYGDIYPVTGLGKFISAVVAITGIGLVALPTGIVSAGFLTSIEKKKNPPKCPYCGEELNF
jgi:voltage-gated potassium channel